MKVKTSKCILKKLKWHFSFCHVSLASATVGILGFRKAFRTRNRGLFILKWIVCFSTLTQRKPRGFVALSQPPRSRSQIFERRLEDPLAPLADQDLAFRVPTVMGEGDCSSKAMTIGVMKLETWRWLDCSANKTDPCMKTDSEQTFKSTVINHEASNRYQVSHNPRRRPEVVQKTWWYRPRQIISSFDDAMDFFKVHVTLRLNKFNIYK